MVHFQTFRSLTEATAHNIDHVRFYSSERLQLRPELSNAGSGGTGGSIEGCKLYWGNIIPMPGIRV